jgi:sec-independent protein translocase protein TatB
MFGISAPEFLVLVAVAAVVLGPERLPSYAQQLGRLVRELRRMAQGATAQVRNEMGPEFEDIDWRKLDPRQYDPRRIVREALADTWDPDDPLGLGPEEKRISTADRTHPMRSSSRAPAAAKTAPADPQRPAPDVDPSPSVDDGVRDPATAPAVFDPDAT